MYRLDTDELIRELHTAVGWDGDVALELLDRIESDEEKN